MWDDYLQSLRGAEVWKAPRYEHPRAVTPVEAKTASDSKQANTSLKKEEMLRHKSFPPKNGDQYYEQSPAGSAHTAVTQQAVKREVFSQSVKKTPGPDKLSFGVIRRLLKLDIDRIVRLKRAAIRTGNCPAACTRASRVVTRKPGTDDYTKLQACSCISQLGWIGKVVEKVAAELRLEDGERMGLMNNGQFGSSNGLSALNARAILVDRAHTVWTTGHISGVLLLVIMEAFPNVVNGRLVNLVKVIQMNRDLAQWTQSFLSGRTVEMIIEGNTM
jgi:hypothetical protein